LSLVDEDLKEDATKEEILRNKRKNILRNSVENYIRTYLMNFFIHFNVDIYSLNPDSQYFSGGDDPDSQSNSLKIEINKDTPSFAEIASIRSHDPMAMIDLTFELNNSTLLEDI
jgi:hypothetical protein